MKYSGYNKELLNYKEETMLILEYFQIISKNINIEAFKNKFLKVNNLPKNSFLISSHFPENRKEKQFIYEILEKFSEVIYISYYPNFIPDKTRSLFFTKRNFLQYTLTSDVFIFFKKHFNLQIILKKIKKCFIHKTPFEKIFPPVNFEQPIEKAFTISYLKDICYNVLRIDYNNIKTLKDYLISFYSEFLSERDLKNNILNPNLKVEDIYLNILEIAIKNKNFLHRMYLSRYYEYKNYFYKQKAGIHENIKNKSFIDILK